MDSRIPSEGVRVEGNFPTPLKPPLMRHEKVTPPRKIVKSVLESFSWSSFLDLFFLDEVTLFWQGDTYRGSKVVALVTKSR